jgi:hypothetical protein
MATDEELYNLHNAGATDDEIRAYEKEHTQPTVQSKQPSIMGKAGKLAIDTLGVPYRALGATATLLSGEPHNAMEIWKGNRTLGTGVTEGINTISPKVGAVVNPYAGLAIDIVADPMMYAGTQIKALERFPAIYKAVEDFNVFKLPAKMLKFPAWLTNKVVTGPMKSGVIPKIAQTASRMVMEGSPKGLTSFPAGISTSNRVSKAIEGISSTLSPMDAISQKLTAAKTYVAAYFNDLVNTLGGNNTFTDIGKQTRLGLNEIKKHVGQVDDGNYAYFKLLFKKSSGTEANIGGASKYLAYEESKLTGTSGKLTPELQKLKDWIAPKLKKGELPKPRTLDDVWKEKKYLNTLIYDNGKKPFLKDSESRIIETFCHKLRSGFSKQLSTIAPAMRNALAEADEAHGMAYKLLASDLFKNIEERVDNLQFDKMVKELVSAKSSEANIDIINDLAKQAPDGGKMVLGGIRASVTKQMLSGMEKEPDMKLLSNRIHSFGGSLDKIFGPEIANKLRDTEFISSALSKSTIKPPTNTTLASEGLGAVAGLLLAPWATLSSLSALVGTNRFLSSPVGQRWLTSGWSNPMLEKTGEKVLTGVKELSRAAYLWGKSTGVK